jgi:hypothetical protein
MYPTASQHPQSSSASRVNTAQAGFFDLSHCVSDLIDRSSPCAPKLCLKAGACRRGGRRSLLAARGARSHKRIFSRPRGVRAAAGPSLTAALAQNRATWPYLPRLSSNSVMRRQNRATKSRQMDGDLCVSVGIDGGGIVVGILSALSAQTHRIRAHLRTKPAAESRLTGCGRDVS